MVRAAVEGCSNRSRRARNARVAARSPRPADRHPPHPGLLVVLPPGEPRRAGPSPRHRRASRGAGPPVRADAARPGRGRDRRSRVVAEMVDRLDVRLVFTAHPTEAVRRSVSYKRRQIAELLTDPTRSEVHRGRPPSSRPPRERGHRPAVADRRAPPREAHVRPTRPSAVLAVLDDLRSNVMGNLLEEFASGPRRRRRRRPSHAPTRPIRDLGGRRPRRQPVRHRRRDRARCSTSIGRPPSPRSSSGIDTLISELSVSTRIVGSSDELTALLDRERERLPGVHRRFARLNAEEPYRFALSYLRASSRRRHDAAPMRIWRTPGVTEFDRRPPGPAPIAARQRRRAHCPTGRSTGSCGWRSRSGSRSPRWTSARTPGSCRRSSQGLVERWPDGPDYAGSPDAETAGVPGRRADPGPSRSPIDRSTSIPSSPPPATCSTSSARPSTATGTTPSRATSCR